jgi:hypothetical protein
MPERISWLSRAVGVCALVAAVVLWFAAGAVQAQDQITLNPETDTWIKKNDMADRSADITLNAAYKPGSGPQESALLRFDLGALHKHDWVDVAEVTLHVESSTWIDVYNEAGVGLFPVNRRWTSNATWSMFDRDQGSSWVEAGCESSVDRDLTPDDVVTFHDDYSVAGDYTWEGMDLTATVQDWQRGARRNEGWLVRLYGGIYLTGKTDRVQFASNEWPMDHERPELFLVYHREAIDWKDEDDSGNGGVWDTTTKNWSWVGGDTTYVDGADPDEVRFSEALGGVISVSGTVSPKKVTITDGWWTFQDGVIGGDTQIDVGGASSTQPRATLEAANTFTGRVNILNDGLVQVSANGALGQTGGGKETWVYDGGMLAFSDGVDYTADETVHCRGHGPDGQNLGALGAFYVGENRFAGTVRVLDDTTVYVEETSSLELTKSIYMASDYELTVKGGGTLELSGNQVFNGRYVVTGDPNSYYSTTLLVNNTSGSATGSGSVTLQAKSILGGSGTIEGAVSVRDDASIAPGNSTGTLTVGSLELSDSSLLAFELGQPGIAGGSANDLIVINGGLVLDGILNVTPEALFDEGTYTLFLYDTGATFTNNGLQFGDMPVGYLYDISTATPGKVELIVTPEPTTLGLLGIGGLTLIRRRRHA